MFGANGRLARRAVFSVLVALAVAMTCSACRGDEEGQIYSISIVDATPIQGTVNSLIGTAAAFHIIVTPRTLDQTPPFRIRVALEATDTETKRETTYQSTFPGEKGSEAYKAGTTYNAFFIAPGVSLGGTGVAKLHLIPEPGKGRDSEVISNTLVVKVKF